MPRFRSWRWIELAIAFGVVAPAARAEMITPDSIPHPPSAVGSVGGTPVYSSNLVTTQYAGLGLNFDVAAITRLNGISVWAPIGIAVGGPAGAIDYAWGVNGDLHSPRVSNLTTITSLSVNIIGDASVTVSGLNNQILNIAPVIRSTGDAHVWTFTGAGISSFATAPSPTSGSWGIAQVSFILDTAPEPSSLILASLGALGLAVRRGWRRVRPIV